MKRFKLLFLFVAGFAFHICAQPFISFTFDDGNTSDLAGYSFDQWNKMILDNLDNAGVKAVFFVVAGYDKLDEKGQYLLKSWNDRGHRIGNHTFSHPNYNNPKVTFEEFRSDFLRNDSVINVLSNYIKLFRFPFLKEGDTRAKIDQFRDCLTANEYRNGYVTVDASDWYVNSRLLARLKENPKADIDGYRKFYLEHLLSRANFYENLAVQLSGRHIHHTILLHHNLTSALFLGDLVKMFREKGWTITDAETAFNDEIFKTNPTNVPAGESLIWALAKQSGKYESILRYPGEDSEYEKARMDQLGL
jgi:peptidoglycan/xylan/chitin deacetylase (PgdA/CDA1 family)